MPLTEKQKVGNLGESVATRFLEKKGFTIITRNYRRKWGEIDIVAGKKNRIYFVEVKTVSREILPDVILENNEYMPEENVHPNKLKRLSRAIQTYLVDYNISDETSWQLDVISVFLDTRNKQAKCRLLQNVL